MHNTNLVESKPFDDAEFFEEELHGSRFHKSQQKERLQKYRKKNPGMKAVKP